ncbi:hypothetical protein LUZ60_010239 [Juncus effusus]|nr:hypothetical protein LUZ60_010239 [Juncus effusus]
MTKNINAFRYTISLLAVTLTVLIQPISCQVSQSCTTALISSFTPCFNFITGSTNGGGSPTSGCCQALGGVISTSTDCACLILTGNVPLGNSLPINRTLAISLPKICKMSSVPLKCRDTATPVSPGPVAFGPALPPLSSDTPLTLTPSFSPEAESPSLTASPPPADDNSGNQGFKSRPLIFPSSSIKSSQINMKHSCVLIFFGFFFV